jgi:hypothetical protein
MTGQHMICKDTLIRVHQSFPPMVLSWRDVIYGVNEISDLANSTARNMSEEAGILRSKDYEKNKVGTVVTK